MNRRAYLAALAGGSSASLSGCSTVRGMFEGEPCDGESCDVGMTRTAFVPDEYTVSAGDTVVWKNTSEADHTVTATHSGPIGEGDAAYFASGGYEDYDTAHEAYFESRGGRIGTRDTFEHTFKVPGSYTYVCLPHEGGGMVGQIHVE